MSGNKSSEVDKIANKSGYNRLTTKDKKMNSYARSDVKRVNVWFPKNGALTVSIQVKNGSQKYHRNVSINQLDSLLSNPNHSAQNGYKTKKNASQQSQLNAYSHPKATPQISQNSNTIARSKKIKNRKRKLNDITSNENSVACQPPSKKTRYALHHSSGLGNARSRSINQQMLVRKQCNEALQSCEEDSIIAFTDGACVGNPGPSGAGCVVEFGKNGIQYSNSEALGRHTNNIGELWAIWLALDIIQKNESSSETSPQTPSETPQLQSTTTTIANKEIEKRKTETGTEKRKVYIFSDSKYTIGVLSENWKATKNTQLIGWIKHELAQMFDRYHFCWNWVGGHSGVAQNEQADRLASAAAQICKQNRKIQVNVTVKPKRTIL